MGVVESPVEDIAWKEVCGGQGKACQTGQEGILACSFEL